MYGSRQPGLLPGFLATILAMAGMIGALPAGAAKSGIIHSPQALPDEPSIQCVVAPEFEIAGLSLYGDLSNLHYLGAPKSMKRGHGEDDGGGYIATTYRYDGLDVTIVRGAIDVIEARGARWPTPSGLKAGMTRREVEALLGRKPDKKHLRKGVYSYNGCPDKRGGAQAWAASSYFEFSFGKNGRLSFVRLAVNRP